MNPAPPVTRTRTPSRYSLSSSSRQRGLGRPRRLRLFAFQGRDHGAGRAEEQGDVERGDPQGGTGSDRAGGRRVRPPLVLRHRGPPQELRGDPERDRGRARRRDGLRRLVDHGLQRDRGVRHGRDPRSGHVPAHALERRRDAGGADDLRHRHPGRQAVRGRPRYVLRRALERMSSLGFDTFNVGPELEYFLFRDDKGTETLDEGGYFAMTTMDAASELRQETVRALHSMGIPIEYVHHEVGPSQHEIDMRYAPALEMADHTVTYRLIVKEIAKKAGYHATFMPKPIFGENGSGMHTHQSLFSDGRNAFFDPDDRWHLSDAGKAFIAGQLRHAREISAVFAQWVNSYKRLVPGYEAPVYVAWSQRNRSALIRIPLYKPGSEQATRAELRCPDPACNPYLTFACLLHAGLEGIEKGYELPDPMETNLYHLTPEQRRERGIVSLPETLGEAIDELSRSELARKALGPHIFDRYVELKRKEWDEYRVQLTDWEMKKYLSVL